MMAYRNYGSKQTCPAGLPAGQAGRRGWKPEYKKFRVRSGIKSFRDLEVYQKTTQLSAEIFQLELPPKIKNRQKLLEELAKLVEISKFVPKLIAESYGDKFASLDTASRKLEKSVQLISDIIAKVDFLTALIEDSDIKEELNKFLKQYQIQRIRILNLKRAWLRVFGDNPNGSTRGVEKINPRG